MDAHKNTESKRPSLFTTEQPSKRRSLQQDGNAKNSMDSRGGQEAIQSTQYAKSLSDDLVCFGAIFHVEVAFHNKAKSELEHERLWAPTLDVSKLKLVKNLMHYRLHYDGIFIGVLHTRLNSVLQRLDDLSEIERQLEADSSSLRETLQKPAKMGFVAPQYQGWHLNINLIGPARLKDHVGEILGKAKVYLQIPRCMPGDLRMMNPHIIEFPDFDTGLEADSSQLSAGDGQPDSSTALAVVFHGLDHGESLHATELDPRIINPLQEYQSRGVDFMLQREASMKKPPFSLWDHSIEPYIGLAHRHKVTGRMSRDPREPYGGILADEMGLGKSLQMLSTIATTQKHASLFVESSSNPLKKSVKTTLIIVPSALLVDNWFSEIERHFEPGTFRAHKYHGNNKQVDVAKLGEYDIVITTYATLAAQSTQSPLRQLLWFRVVLDEAHNIRNQKTEYYRAVASLSAKIRWCLSGTPIQNSLEDLGSLVRFLQIDSLEIPRDFRRHCITPALERKNFHNIRALLKCICLRRTKELLQLPDLRTSEHVIEMSLLEKAQYDDIKDKYRRAIDDAICGRSPADGYRSVLSALLKLRMACNHGVSLSRNEDEDDMLALLQTGTTTCAYCGREVNMDTDGPKAESAVARLVPCSHVVCGDCLGDYQNDTEKIREGVEVKCPECLEPLERERSTSVEGPETGLRSPLPNTVSSKFTRIVEDLKEHKSKEKSMIFSCWKKTLNELASILTSEGLPFVLLDGTLTLSARREVLEKFNQESDTILLMTLGTGAVGLNLTVASRIHLIEPQWNPTIEFQAIGRAARLGQNRQVSVVRYIMKDSVEQYIQSRQNRKMELATLGFGQNKGTTSVDTKLQKLTELREFLDV